MLTFNNLYHELNYPEPDIFQYLNPFLRNDLPIIKIKMAIRLPNGHF
jgi:hypothetical protein